jgi:threonine dehydrogenase-like Zn-dependent dehydrogenase
MRAVRYVDGAIRVVEAPAPRDGVRVRVRSCGICGSDLHMIDSGFPMDQIPGHEIAGELADGTPVAIEPIAPCGRCEFCTTGDYQLCRQGAGMVFGVARDGGMADEISVPERALVPLPRGVALRDASLVEPLAVAIHGLRKLRVAAGQRVVVVGGGAIGLCAVAALAASGAEVGLAARHEAQRAAGERLGAREPGGEYPLVIDAAGTTSSVERAAELARPGASLLLLATFWEGMTLPWMTLSMKELSVVSAVMYGRDAAGRDIDLAAALLAARPWIAQVLITHRFPLDAAAEAFATARDRSSGSIKVVLEP